MDGLKPTLLDDTVEHTSDGKALPEQLDGFLIGAKIGSGGMASVYRAKQLSPPRDVALKVLGVERRDDERFVARFDREAVLQASLQHPNIVPIYQSGVCDGVPFIAMMLVDGPTLKSLVRMARPPAGEVVEMLAGVASALDFAHARGVVHGDVKPQNVLIDESGHAWLADFGLTRLIDEQTGLTSAGAPLGSFDYLAPEIADGEPATPSSDVYSLAVTAFFALTGSLPFPARCHSQSLLAHAHAIRPSASQRVPSLPPALDEVLRDGMAIDPAARPSSPGALIDRLRTALGSVPVADDEEREPTTQMPADSEADTLTTSPTERIGGLRLRRALLGGLVVTLVIAAVAVFGVAAGHLKRSGGGGSGSAGIAETVGGPSHTWTDFHNASGIQGAVIPSYHSVLIACRVKGFAVQDGDRWWYRIASAPWNRRFYVSADAFYNNGENHGSLLHTPLFDPKVPTC